MCDRGRKLRPTFGWLLRSFLGRRHESVYVTREKVYEKFGRRFFRTGFVWRVYV